MDSNLIRFIIAAVFMAIGAVFYVFQFIGVFRFKDTMNRMHSAAMGDTMGSGCMMLGVLILSGFNMASLKIILMIAIVWITAPVGTHMLARLYVLSREDITEVAEVIDVTEGEAVADQEVKA